MESLLITSRPDDADTSTSNIPEPDVEPSEVGADDEEHPERLLGVFDLRQESRVEAERQGDLCDGISYGLSRLTETTHW